MSLRHIDQIIKDLKDIRLEEAGVATRKQNLIAELAHLRKLTQDTLDDVLADTPSPSTEG